METENRIGEVFAPLMEPASGSRARPWTWTSCSHHHHHPHPHPHHHHHHPLIIFPHHHHLFLCPRHNHHHNHLNFHGHVSASPALLPPPNSQQMGAAPLQNESALFKDATDQYHGTQMLQENEPCGLEEAEEDDEPIFVLTDEWREFFAKSEAKRKLEKKQAKRK